MQSALNASQVPSYPFPILTNLIVGYVLMNTVTARKQFLLELLFPLQVTR